MTLSWIDTNIFSKKKKPRKCDRHHFIWREL